MPKSGTMKVKQIILWLLFPNFLSKLTYSAISSSVVKTIYRVFFMANWLHISMLEEDFVDRIENWYAIYQCLPDFTVNDRISTLS